MREEEDDRLEEIAGYLAEITSHLDSIRFMIKAWWVLTLAWVVVAVIAWAMTSS